jgi:hypothetical protein
MYRHALTELARLDVPGVTINYDVDAIPETLPRGRLPALLVLPIDPRDMADDRRLFRERSDSFRVPAFSDGVKTITFPVTHLLLAAPLAAGSGLRTHLPGLVDLIDAYFAALAAEVTLGGRLLEPARVRVEPGIFTYGDVVYCGCAFRHTWIIGV